MGRWIRDQTTFYPDAVEYIKQIDLMSGTNCNSPAQ
jgi:hypothetical protein